jgi:hypothetical protein
MNHYDVIVMGLCQATAAGAGQWPTIFLKGSAFVL